MAVASFQELCAGFCELARVPLPALSADAEGRVAFHVILRGATVNLVHCPETSEDHVFVLFELGAVGNNGADPSGELQALLDANFSPLRVHPPMFSRNAATGVALLQYVYPLFDATANDLFELVEEGCEWVSNWRQNLVAPNEIHSRPLEAMPPPGMFQHVA